MKVATTPASPKRSAPTAAWSVRPARLRLQSRSQPVSFHTTAPWISADPHDEHVGRFGVSTCRRIDGAADKIAIARSASSAGTIRETPENSLQRRFTYAGIPRGEYRLVRRPTNPNEGLVSGDSIRHSAPAQSRQRT